MQKKKKTQYQQVKEHLLEHNDTLTSLTEQVNTGFKSKVLTGLRLFDDDIRFTPHDDFFTVFLLC